MTVLYIFYIIFSPIFNTMGMSHLQTLWRIANIATCTLHERRCWLLMLLMLLC